MQHLRVYYDVTKAKDLRSWVHMSSVNQFVKFDQIDSWLQETYGAHVVDDQVNIWYIQFPDQESLIRFQFAWCS